MSDRNVHGLLFTPENVERLLREAESPGNGKSQTRRLATPHNSLSGQPAPHAAGLVAGIPHHRLQRQRHFEGPVAAWQQ